jgi:hypothetical protein
VCGQIPSLHDGSTEPANVRGGIGLQGHPFTHPGSQGASHREKGGSAAQNVSLAGLSLDCTLLLPSVRLFGCWDLGLILPTL